MTKQSKATEVFLNVRPMTKRRAGFAEINRVFYIAEWHTRGTSTVLYKSKQCATRDEARKLARAWLAKQNERPARIDNVIAAMEWSGPRYVDTTRDLETHSACEPAVTVMTLDASANMKQVAAYVASPIDDQADSIAAIVDSFPVSFGLRAFPGKVFRASPVHSYRGDDGAAMIYTDVRGPDGTWRAFSKASAAELRREIVTIEQAAESPAQALANLAARALANGGDMTAAVAASDVASWSADKLAMERRQFAQSVDQAEHDRALAIVLGALNGELAKLQDDRTRLRLIVSIAREVERRLVTRSVR